MAQNNNYQQGGTQFPYPSSSMPQPMLQPALQTPRLNQRAPFPPNNNNNNFIDQSFYNNNNNNNQQNPMYNQNLMPGFNQMPPNFNPNGQMMNFNQPPPPQQMGNFMQQQPPPPMMGNNFDYQSQMPNYNQPPPMMPPNSYSNYPPQPPPQSQHHLQPLPPPAPSRLKQLDHRDSNVLNMIPSNKNQRNESVAPELNSFRQEKLIKLLDLSPAPYDMM